MNTSGLLQETRSIHDSVNIPKFFNSFLKYVYIAQVEEISDYFYSLFFEKI